MKDAAPSAVLQAIPARQGLFWWVVMQKSKPVQHSQAPRLLFEFIELFEPVFEFIVHVPSRKQVAPYAPASTPVPRAPMAASSLGWCWGCRQCLQVGDVPGCLREATERRNTALWTTPSMQKRGRTTCLLRCTPVCTHVHKQLHVCHCTELLPLCCLWQLLTVADGDTRLFSCPWAIHFLP